MAAGELEDQPRVDRAEHRRGRAPPRTLRRSHSILVPEKYGSSTRPGALADELLVALGAKLVAAIGGAPVLPNERACGSARRVPGSQATTVSRWLVMPIASSSGALDAGVDDRLDRDAAGDVPDLGRVVLDPARPREVLAELAVAAAGDPAVARRRPGTSIPVVPWSIARITARQALTASALQPVDAREVAQLAAAMEEAAEALAGRPMLEVELDLLAPESPHGRRRW